MPNRVKNIIFGNSIAALTCAEQLKHQKKDFLLISPSQYMGGHFQGINLLSSHFDVGMNLLEFTSYNSDESKMETYNPKIKNDSGRFVNRIRDYITKHLGVSCQAVKSPEIEIMGQIFKDFLISDNFSTLSELPDELIKLFDEKRSDSLHPKHKNTNNGFLTTSLKEVSLKNHGKNFHDFFIESLCQKITNCSSEQFIAKFHRLTWMPLIYPETLNQYLKGESQQLPSINFEYPSQSSMLHIINKYKEKLEFESNDNPFYTGNIQNIECEDKTWSLTVNGEKLFCENFIWAQDIESLGNLISPIEKKIEKANVACVFLKIPKQLVKKEFSSLFIVDTNTPFYRATDYSVCAKSEESHHRICIEANLDNLRKVYSDNENLITDSAIDLLYKMKIVSQPNNIESHFKSFNSALLLPSFENFELFNKIEKMVVEKYPQIIRIGGSAGFSSFAFNDQIIQGMMVANEC